VFVGIILLAFLFAVNNTTEVNLWIGIQLPALSVGVLVICAFIIGGVLGLVLGVGVFRQLKYILQIKQLRSQLEKANKNSQSGQHTGRQE
jgi:uncharacterized integral membrane protein